MTGGDPVSWDRYVAEHKITEDEAPQAFAAYLHALSGGTWMDKMERVTDDAHPDRWADDAT